MNLPLYSPTAPAAGAKPGYAEYELDVHCHTSPNNWRIGTEALAADAGAG